MMLAIDIGNTNMTFGVFKGSRLIKKVNIPACCSERETARKIRQGFLIYNIEAVVISSVVPKAEKLLGLIIRKVFKIKPLVLGRDVIVPVRNLYKRPGEVGQDRLVNAYAGCQLYKAPLIIIDFGTAVTFDVVSETGAYLGGIIAPGIDMTLAALSEKTALLPKIKLSKAPSIVGKTTAESIASGVFYGFASMCDGLVERLKKASGLKFNVMATGGNAHLISQFSASIKRLDGDLTLKGINLTYQTIFAKKT